ncbi:MAG: prepilin-type N-terminal cleavage/methylation domain-containing protein [Planctomycetes bacterium]|nr:prepilin-type N-terminal cleavage/methylation domain-containing protein [Planctomycetota bacterium]
MHAIPRARQGFTAIEMLMVVGIVLILATMAVPAIVPALRRGQVNDAASAIMQISKEARLLAMHAAAPADNSHYGIAIIDDPAFDPQVVVALIYGISGASPKASIVKDANGKNVAIKKLARSVAVYTGATELRAAGGVLSWFYQYRTGMPIGVFAGAFSTTPVSVGCPSITVSNVWGTGNTAIAASVAPGTATVPGLSVRTVDDKIRRAIAVYVSGVPVTGEF